MEQREKLIKLLEECYMTFSTRERVADYLLSHGVIVQPCELAQENDKLRQTVARLCKERDDANRASNLESALGYCEVARADALQRRCDDLEKSRQAWVRKCEALIGQLQETMEEREKLKGLADEYLRAYYRLDAKHDELIRHPWRNLWRHIKEALGIG